VSKGRTNLILSRTKGACQYLEADIQGNCI
jgi:hypothetical protein